jgi:hypothetical protein
MSAKRKLPVAESFVQAIDSVTAEINSINRAGVLRGSGPFVCTTRVAVSTPKYRDLVWRGEC